MRARHCLTGLLALGLTVQTTASCEPPADVLPPNSPLLSCQRDAPRVVGDRARFRRAADRRFEGLDEPRWRGPFFFVQISDSQFGVIPGSGCNFTETTNAEQTVAVINGLRPRFVVLTGDLVENLDGPLELAAPQLAEFKRVFRQLDPEIPLVVLPGNHELGNLPTAAAMARYREHFGDDYFAFSVGGLRALVLDTPLLFNWTELPQALVEQGAWLQAELAAARSVPPQHLVVFQHHPWFVEDVDEPDSYFNLPQQNRKLVLDALDQAHVRAVFSGHLHRNVYRAYGGIELVSSGTVCPCIEPGLRVVEVYADRLEHRFFSLADVPPAIELTGE